MEKTDEQVREALEICTTMSNCMNCAYKEDFHMICHRHLMEDIKRVLNAQDNLLRSYAKQIKDGFVALRNATKIIKSQPDVVRCDQCRCWISGKIDEDNNPIPPMCTYLNKPRHAYDYCIRAEKIPDEL